MPPREHPLAGVERELKVPPRRRLDLIEEVEGDVRGLQAVLRGHSPARARRVALQQLVPGGEALDRLEARHAPRPRRWVRAADWLDHAVRVGVGSAATLAGAAAFTLAASGSSGVSTANRKFGGLERGQVVVGWLSGANRMSGFRST